jgi:hypothetical protein
MHSLIRIVFALFFSSLGSLNGFAGTNFCRPVNGFVHPLPHKKLSDIFLLDSVMAASSEGSTVTTEDQTSGSAQRICSCQVLNLGSSNYDHRHMVLLAEKAYDGKRSAFILARRRLQQEKKNLKKMFYDKVQVIAELQGTGSCRSMYFRLHTADSHLQLYEILNADLR